MPTQEERITNLEQFQRETIAAVQASNMYITQQMCIVSEQEVDIKRTLAILEQHSELLLQHSEAIRELLARLPAKE